MFHLQKVEMGWKKCRNPREIESFLIEEGAGETWVRINPGVPSLVNITVTNILPEEVSSKFTQLQSGLRENVTLLNSFFVRIKMVDYQSMI